MNTGCATTRISTGGETSVPSHGTFCRTGDRLTSGYSLGSCFTRIELFEDHTITVTLFRCWGVVGESVGGVGKHLIRHFLRGNVLERVNPSVTNSVAELLLLPPQNFIGKVRVFRCIEGFSHAPFFNSFIFRRNILSCLDLLFFGVDGHRNLQEISIKEWHTWLHAPSRHGLVAPKTIVHMKPGDFIDTFFMEFPSVGGFMEVQVSPEYLISSLSTQNHLNSHRLNLTGHEVHRCGGTNCCHIVSLKRLDHITDSIGTLLKRVGIGVMYGSEKIGDLLCSFKIR
mmetsp:Transcript_28322/g.41660  ORF Transcript_28322/g.41660 Transcript_28322/m.41660 type:complete len:284 (-) Transcript_28322:930-1781(-)